MKLLMVLLLATVAVGCGYSKSTTPPSPGTTPNITQLNPSSTAAMGPAFTLEVDGTSFAGAAVVKFNGAAQTTTRVSATKLTAQIPASAITTAGTVPVTVTNPGTPGGPYGGGTSPATSTPMDFTINP